MRVDTVLVREASSLAGRIKSVAPASAALNALVLMSLGLEHRQLLNAVSEAGVQCPVYVTETYGILGYDEGAGRNVELMEKGRGSEYGFVGGSGGQGCLVLAYSGGAAAGHTAAWPADAASMMVVADGSGAFAAAAASAPLHYGGITKEAWVLSDGALQPVPFFWVASVAGGAAPVGVTTFTGEAGEAALGLLEQAPGPVSAVGLFPCFTRGVNKYDAEDVETAAIAQVVGASRRMYGMFAHGELGPSRFSGFDSAAPAGGVPSEQHSMTSILALHTHSQADEKDEL